MMQDELTDYLERTEQMKRKSKKINAIGTSDEIESLKDQEWNWQYDQDWSTWICMAVPAAKRQRTDDDDDSGGAGAPGKGDESLKGKR